MGVNIKYKTILITGGAGFIGSSLALSLRRKYPSLNVIALDNLKRRGSELNLPRLKEAGIRFVHGDIRNPEDLRLDDEIGLMIEASAEPSVLAGFDRASRGGPADGGNSTLRCIEHVQAQIGRQGMAHGEPANAVALLVESGREDGNPEATRLHRHDAAADTALGGQSGTVKPVARGVVHAAGGHHGKDVGNVFLRDGALACARLELLKVGFQGGRWIIFNSSARP